MNFGRDEDFCKRLDKIAREDHSYIATWEERRRYEKGQNFCLNTLGSVGPMNSTPDYLEAVRRIREVKREAEEAGHEINPAIRPSLQVRQRPGQPFQKPDTCTVDPTTGWVWWSSSEAPSSTTSPNTWWSSTDWKEY